MHKQRLLLILLKTSLALVLFGQSARAADPVPAPAPVPVLHRLEPTGQRVLQGAGSGPADFRPYFDAVGDNKPAIYMAYLSLKGQPADLTSRMAGLKKELDSYPVFLVPQIGLCMTRDGHPQEHYEDKVAAGEYDANIEALCQGLHDLGRPVFLRIGYEFNGPWNGYQPESYKAAWTRIVGKLRAHGLDNVATIWCVGTSAKDFMKYYPGDDTVDWWGIDIFSPIGKFDEGFVKQAAQRGFPVMICESTPRHIGVLDGEASWKKWFEPYFTFIARNTNVKGFCYISRDWSHHREWAKWGDSRIAQNPAVLAPYKTELAKPLYFNGTDRASTESLLRVGANPVSPLTGNP